MYKRRPLTVLVDCGSTDSFIDSAVAKKMKASMETVSLLSVIVANGQRSISNPKCPQFTWEMHGKPLTTELRVLQLGSCDLILGVVWIKGFNLIVFDFDDYKLSLIKGLKKVNLLGIKEEASLRMITLSKLWKLISVSFGKPCMLNRSNISRSSRGTI